MGGIYASCISTAPQNSLTVMLEQALSKYGMSELLPEERNKINEMIMEATSKKFNTSEFEVLLQMRVYPPPAKREKGSDASARLIYRRAGAANNKGLIIYEDAFYYGDIMNNSAEAARAALHFRQSGSEREYIVRGSWEMDDLKRGEVSEAVAEGENLLFEIERNRDNKNKAIIRFKSGDLLTYEGTLDWSKLHLAAMLTGEGKISFRNGSEYVGGIKNGLMDTQATKKPAIFKTLGEIEKYEGHYKEGLRHGEGTSLIKKESMKYSYTLNWINGSPDISSFAYNSRDPRETLFKSKVNRL